MRIAIVGSGIAGNAAALALTLADARNEVVVYEKADRPGGHSATVDIDWDGTKIAVDTGFIVYNEVNYPNFTALLDFLGVRTKPATMSFSMSVDGGRYEWSGRDGGLLHVARGLFAQRRNLASPAHIGMLSEVLRFQERAIGEVRTGDVGDGTLGDWLGRHGFSTKLCEDYLLPMGAAIWSTSPAEMLQFPAAHFLEFFDNHFLLQWERPQWRTVDGGSRSYVEKLVRHFRNRLRLSTAVVELRRTEQGVELRDSHGDVETFDHVVVAAHAPDALAMLADADVQERAILGACGTVPNDVWLHRDTNLMPRRRDAWAAWNVLRNSAAPNEKLAATYWMNALQGIDPRCPVFVTLNPPREPAPHLTFGRWHFDHPRFDTASVAAAARLPEIQGRRNVWFCGAWTGHGFHEDGMASGLTVARALGAAGPWAAADTGHWREAAE